MANVSSLDSFPCQGGILPPIPIVPFWIVCASPWIVWCQVWAVPFRGGGGSFPSAPGTCQFSTVPCALSPWQTAQFWRYKFWPCWRITGSVIRSDCAWDGTTSVVDKNPRKENNVTAICFDFKCIIKWCNRISPISVIANSCMATVR